MPPMVKRIASRWPISIPGPPAKVPVSTRSHEAVGAPLEWTKTAGGPTATGRPAACCPGGSCHAASNTPNRAEDARRGVLER